jgi:hypothetical protein
MEAINPLNHYYNLFCLGRLSENISNVRIAVLLFLKIKLHNKIFFISPFPPIFQFSSFVVPL